MLYFLLGYYFCTYFYLCDNLWFFIASSVPYTVYVYSFIIIYQTIKNMFKFTSNILNLFLIVANIILSSLLSILLLLLFCEVFSITLLLCFVAFDIIGVVDFG